MRTRFSVDVLIIGAGPAGLAAAQACFDSGSNYELIELGNVLEQRDHTDAANLASGVGGAGLFSDGKFSFYPSATALWGLHPRNDVARAYQWVSQILRDTAIRVPDFPTPISVVGEAPSLGVHFEQKSYPSFYLDLEHRKKLITSLQSRISGNVQTASLVTSISGDSTACAAIVKRMASSEPEEIRAKAIIIATGRFTPLLTQNCVSIPQIFRRLEVGVRIEQPSGRFFLAQQMSLDPKFVMSDRKNCVEWRTFCCCREGEVVAIGHDGVLAVSGRSDVTATGFSNVGFHVRLTDKDRARALWGPLLKRIRSITIPARMTLDDFMSTNVPEQTPVGTVLGIELTSALRAGLSNLIEEFGVENFSDATLHAPALEGLATYPHFGSDLRCPNMPIWGAGDATGLFRGLVAGLVSGYFAGLQVAQAMGSVHEQHR